MKEKHFTLYKHTCPNNKVYIGITSQKPTKRWGNGSGYIRNKHFYNAILKYGWDNIKHEILYENIPEREIYGLEQQVIAEHKSTDRRYGYNNSVGGECGGLGIEFTEERKYELSQRYTGEGNPFYNKHHTEEVKRRLREKRLGKKHTEEEIKKMAKASPKKKKVYQYTEEDELVGYYESKRQAIRETGIDMGKVLTMKKRTAGGFKWSYEKL